MEPPMVSIEIAGDTSKDVCDVLRCLAGSRRDVMDVGTIHRHAIAAARGSATSSPTRDSGEAGESSDSSRG